MSKDKDISRTVVVILLIATIIVSLVGTWIVFKTIDSANAKKTYNGHVLNSQATVGVEIAKPQTPEPVTTTGGISVNVISRA